MIITITLNPALDKTLEVPDFSVGQHARAEIKSFIPAGKGINVARGLNRMRRACVACALVGRREEGLFADMLKEAPMTEPALFPVEGITRTNTTILDSQNGTTTHLREKGFDVRAADLAELREWLSNRLTGRDERVRTVFCGSLPPGVSPDVFADLLTHCCELGAQVICDTSGEALKAAIQSGSVHTVKPNLSELSQCLGRDVEPETAPYAARALLDRVKEVLLTLGRRGAYAIEAGTESGMCCPLPAEEVNNTVGCGDAFLAGWLDALESGADSAFALKQAVSAGAASACGATAVDYTRGCVDARLDQCREIARDVDGNSE